MHKVKYYPNWEHNNIEGIFPERCWQPRRKWQVDLQQLEALVDDTVVAIVINNPSNPCGSVFSKAHLQDLAALAIRHKIPVIADEIYDHFVSDFANRFLNW